jgi:hypothetical protein
MHQHHAPRHTALTQESVGLGRLRDLETLGDLGFD